MARNRAPSAGVQPVMTGRGRSSAALLLVAIAALTGCATGPTNLAQSASPVATGSASSSPQLALIAATFESKTGLYAVQDPAAPKLLKELPGVRKAKFVSASAISYVAIPNFTPTTSFMDYDSHLTLLHLADGSATTIARTTGNIWDFGWNQAGTDVAYELQTVAGWQLWLKRENAQPISLTAVAVNAKFEGGPGDGVWVTFSPSGTYLAMANTFAAGPHLQVFRVADGARVWSTAKGGSLFWARNNDRLYFEDFAGEHGWDAPDRVTTPLPDGWVDPSVSPDQCCVAFSRQDNQGVPHVEIYNWTSGLTKLPAAPGAYPHFISAEILWLLAIQPGAAQAPGAAPYQTTGAVSAYDVRSTKRTVVSIKGQPNDAPTVFDIWPH
jgi:hypothetical protein